MCIDGGVACCASQVLVFSVGDVLSSAVVSVLLCQTEVNKEQLRREQIMKLIQRADIKIFFVFLHHFRQQIVGMVLQITVKNLFPKTNAILLITSKFLGCQRSKFIEKMYVNFSNTQAICNFTN